jgi:hypothetical protein
MTLKINPLHNPLSPQTAQRERPGCGPEDSFVTSELEKNNQGHSRLFTMNTAT